MKFFLMLFICSLLPLFSLQPPSCVFNQGACEWCHPAAARHRPGRQPAALATRGAPTGRHDGRILRLDANNRPRDDDGAHRPPELPVRQGGRRGNSPFFSHHTPSHALTPLLLRRPTRESPSTFRAAGARRTTRRRWCARTAR